MRPPRSPSHSIHLKRSRIRLSVCALRWVLMMVLFIGNLASSFPVYGESSPRGMGLAGATAVRAAYRSFVGLDLSGAQVVPGHLDQLPTIISFESPFVFSCSLKCSAHSHFLSGPTSMNLLAFSLQTEHFF